MANEGVTISLTDDEALVLFELLHRWEDTGQISPPQHQAELTALWNLSALLKRTLQQPFSPEYGQLVTHARERLTGQG